MALPQGLLNSYWSRFNQRRALTGMPTSYQEQRGMSDSLLNAGVADLENQYQRDLRNRQLNMQEQAAKDQARAATISGITNTGGLLMTGGLTYKALQNQAATNDILRQYLLGAGSGGGQVLPAAGSGAMATGGMLPGPAGTGLAEGAGPASVISGGAAPAVTPLAAAGTGAGLFAGQYLTGRSMQPTLDKAGFSMAGKGWTYGGLPGAMVGGSLDIGKKAFSEVHDFISKLF